MKSVHIDDQLVRAVELRNSGNAEAARDLLSDLNAQRPDDPQVNLQSAWTHDKLGLEKEAVPFYERALELGLAGDDLRHALLGLGSTYRHSVSMRSQRRRSLAASRRPRRPGSQGLPGHGPVQQRTRQGGV
jgi:hypothetical protein